ncbi:MAG: hypothetical protein ACF8GE_02390 [Phycisphaerales bacterium JB043]
MTSAQLDDVDRTLLSRFQNRELTHAEWTHAMHIRMGWIHVRLHGFDEALVAMRRLIPRLNDSHGVPNSDKEGYHETLTRLWLALIAHADASGDVHAESSEAFLARHPEMLDKELPLRFYTRGHLMSVEARLAWAEPDVEALPASV